MKEHPVEKAVAEGRGYEGKWSAPFPVPAVAEVVTASFGGQHIACRVEGYFETADYLGVSLHMLELPVGLEVFGYGQLLLERTGSNGVPADLIYDMPKLRLFGAEIRQHEVDTLPKWCMAEGLKAEHELAVLLAAGSCPKKEWKDVLTITAWCNGQWHSTPYPDLMGALQTVRNTGHWAYVEWAVEKNQTFITKLRDILCPKKRKR